MAGVLRLALAWSIPLGVSHGCIEAAPDEALQLWTTRLYAQGRLESWPASRSIYSAFPPAQYALQAAALRLGWSTPWPDGFTRFAPVAEPEAFRGHGWARLGSVLLGMLSVVVAFALVREWAGPGVDARFGGLIAALHPQLGFVASYVNGDAFTTLAGLLLALALSRWALRGEGDDGLAGVGAAAGLVLLGKPGGLALLVGAAPWLGLAVARGGITRVALWRVFATVGVVAAPVLVGNAIRNHGDPSGLGAYRSLLAAGYHATPPDAVPGAFGLFWLRSAQSAFALPGRMQLLLPGPIYAAALGLVSVGGTAALARLPRATAAQRRATAWLLASATLSILVSLANSWTQDFQPQGRYVLAPALLLLLLACVAPVSGRRSLPASAWRATALAIVSCAAGASFGLVWSASGPAPG